MAFNKVNLFSEIWKYSIKWREDVISKNKTKQNKTKQRNEYNQDFETPLALQKKRGRLRDAQKWIKEKNNDYVTRETGLKFCDAQSSFEGPFAIRYFSKKRPGQN